MNITIFHFIAAAMTTAAPGAFMYQHFNTCIYGFEGNNISRKVFLSLTDRLCLIRLLSGAKISNFQSQIFKTFLRFFIIFSPKFCQSPSNDDNFEEDDA